MTDDHRLVRAFLDRTTAMSAREAGAEIGVSHETVARWRRGDWVRLTADIRRTLLAHADELAEVSYGEGGARRDSEALDFSQISAVDLVLQRGFLRSFLSEIAPPGAETDMKLDALHHFRMLITLFEPPPRWWFETRRDVRQGRL